MQITEPMTMVSDYLLAGFAVLLALRLLRLGRLLSQASIRLWGFALLATAMGAVAGGTSHGFSLYLGEAGHAVAWKLTVYSIGVASMLMLAGSIIASVPRWLRQWLISAAVIQFGVYAVWMLTHDEFVYVIYDYVPSMIGLVALHGYSWYSQRDVAAPWIVAGVAVSFAAAGIQQSGWSLHEHFNYNDMYHLVQMAGLFFFYAGARVLRDP